MGSYAAFFSKQGLLEKEMINRIGYISFLVLTVLLPISCLYSRTTAPSFAVKAGIKIINGNATIKIDGKVNENLYSTSIFDTQIKDDNYYGNPTIREGTISKKEIKHLGSGEEYMVSVLPTEVVTLNIVSSDSNDVDIIIYQYGREKKYTISGNNRLGFTIAFQNR
ncbi:MAG: hypothetical protein LBG74_05320 [Spirochaetaceae bacterium]|jgi:hypothetical protein|nr:hypothetical protein [Spirochaetaceae bacterium]